MMKIKLLLLAITSLIFFSLAPSTHADKQDFIITNFTADYYLDKSDQHGHMRVVEQIEVNFSDYNHGILRAIPDGYKGHSLKIDNIKTTKSDGSVWKYTTYSGSNNLVLQVGDPNNTVTGLNTFIIEYELTGPISFYDDHDELFWDVNGDQWSQSFENVTARLHLGNDLSGSLQQQRKCFVGGYGSKSENCTMVQQNSSNETTITTTANNLSGYQTLSFVVAFNSGTFVPYTWQDELREHYKDLVLGLGIFVLLMLAFRQWWLKGKDYKGRGIIIPEYAPPKGIDVLSAGILQDYVLDNKDITAGIINLAVKGYITIVEEDKKKLLVFKSSDYSLKLNNTDTSKLNEYEVRLIHAIFSPFEKDKTVLLGTYDSKLQKATIKIGDDLTQQLTEEGYFDHNPKKAPKTRLALYVVLTILIVVIAFILSAPIAGIVGILSIVIIFILMALMPRRSRKGVATHEKLKGLKYYIQMAEKDRIKFLQSPNAKYAKNSHEPKRTVELFEKLLPYAIIFGAEKQWAKEFENLYKTPPDWYQGNYSTFNTVMLTNHIMSSTSAMTTTFAPPSSSSGSGFSGGGGAGGGGGGGGGGGW